MTGCALRAWNYSTESLDLLCIQVTWSQALHTPLSDRKKHTWPGIGSEETASSCL